MGVKSARSRERFERWGNLKRIWRLCGEAGEIWASRSSALVTLSLVGSSSLVFSVVGTTVELGVVSKVVGEGDVKRGGERCR